MWILYIFLYILIGSICAGFLAYRIAREEGFFDIESELNRVYAVGLFWPIVAPIVFAAIAANDYAEKKKSRD